MGSNGQRPGSRREFSDAEAVWREETAFVSITEATATTAGVEFFRTLVRELATSLGVAYAFVAEFAGSPRRVRTIAFWGNGAWQDDVEYDLLGTPCADVLSGHLCFYRDDVQRLFPRDRDLMKIDARSYLGVPLLNPDGEAVGHLAVIDTRPMEDDPRGLSIFRMFANRARVELERLRAETALARARRALEFEVEQKSRDLGLARRELTALLGINRAVARHLRREDLFETVGRVVRELVPAERMVVLIPKGEGQEVTIFAQHAGEPGSRVVEGESFASRHSAAGWVYGQRKIFRGGDPGEIGKRFPATAKKLRDEGMQSICALPLLSGESCLGVLGFMARDPRAYAGVPDELLEQIGAAVAVALDNCMAYEELSRLRDQLAAENVYLQEEIRSEHDFREIVGNSRALLEVLARVETVAATSSTVLILGETGTGKELIARAVHDRSSRRGRPLVKVNCSAISAGLVESELFGHRKGAFTGAVADRVGRFELADGGTIFLDEIGDLPPETQVKILRVLQEKEFEPVGSSKTRRVDVRVIAATNRDLEAAVAEGSFRPDLFYRLNVLPISVPALRERREDVPLLVSYFLERFAKEIGKPIRGVDPASVERLASYDWPGNVRELQNLIERAAVLTPPGSRLVLDADLQPVRVAPERPPDTAGERAGDGRAQVLTLKEVERRHIRAALERSAGVIDGPRGAAGILGLHPNTLRDRMKKLGLERPAPTTSRDRSRRP